MKCMIPAFVVSLGCLFSACDSRNLWHAINEEPPELPAGIESVSPQPGEVNVSPGANVVVRLKRDINPSLVNSGNVVVESSLDEERYEPVTGAFSYSIEEDAYSFTFVPDGFLLRGRLYRVTIHTPILTALGISEQLPPFTFRTAPPVEVAYEPASGARKVDAATSVITITFSDEMRAEGSVTVGGGNVAGGSEQGWDEGRRVYTIRNIVFKKGLPGEGDVVVITGSGFRSELDGVAVEVSASFTLQTTWSDIATGLPDVSPGSKRSCVLACGADATIYCAILGTSGIGVYRLNADSWVKMGKDIPADNKSTVDLTIDAKIGALVGYRDGRNGPDGGRAAVANFAGGAWNNLTLGGDPVLSLHEVDDVRVASYDGTTYILFSEGVDSTGNVEELSLLSCAEGKCAVAGSPGEIMAKDINNKIIADSIGHIVLTGRKETIYIAYNGMETRYLLNSYTPGPAASWYKCLYEPDNSEGSGPRGFVHFAYNGYGSGMLYMLDYGYSAADAFAFHAIPSMSPKPFPVSGRNIIENAEPEFAITFCHERAYFAYVDGTTRRVVVAGSGMDGWHADQGWEFVSGPGADRPSLVLAGDVLCIAYRDIANGNRLVIRRHDL